MKNIIKRILKMKQFHAIVVSLIIFLIIFITGVITLIYNVEGDRNLPFYLSKISIISSVEGTDSKEDLENKWNIQINENNDIYLYIKKNENYKNAEIIESIEIDNFKVEKRPKKGTLKLYKPDSKNANTIFSNVEENETQKIEYIGTEEANIKNSTISNQGGLVVFRYSISDLGNYISNEDEQINHSELLNKLNIDNEDLKFKVSFDICINLEARKKYKANIELELPINNVVTDGTQSTEYTELSNIKFKRVSKNL